MLRRARWWLVSLLLVPAGPSLGQGGPDQERVAKNKQAVLSRVEREPVAFRGDKPGQMRVKWEWYDKVVSNYRYEKAAFVDELAAGEKFLLRPGWVYKDMKVTFQEIFALGPEHDDKLLPIISNDGLLQLAPSETLVGLALLGKQGEPKGVCTRKFKERGYGTILTRLEYRDREGKLQTAGGLAYDAITVRWKDVKDRIADDNSAAKAVEDLKLERDALFPAAPGN